jgi:hypothetical protein
MFYFTPLPGFFSPFPRGTNRYRSQTVFSLTRWSSQIHTGFLVSRATQDAARGSSIVDYGTITLYRCAFQRIHLTDSLPCRCPTTPENRNLLVWALPRSLAATKGIVFTFFSSGY